MGDNIWGIMVCYKDGHQSLVSGRNIMHVVVQETLQTESNGAVSKAVHTFFICFISDLRAGFRCEVLFVLLLQLYRSLKELQKQSHTIKSLT